MVVPFSCEYGAVTLSLTFNRLMFEEYSEYLQEAIAVEGATWAKALTGCHGLAGSNLKDRGVLSEYLYNECKSHNNGKKCLFANNLIYPKGMAT